MHFSPTDCLLLKDMDIQAPCYRDGMKETSPLYPFCTFQHDYQLLSDQVQALRILIAKGVSTHSLQSFHKELKLLSTATWIYVCSMCSLEYRI